jgi:hypothetical protein
MTVMNQDGSSTSITNDTELISEKMKALLMKLESGSKLFFEGIVAICSDGSTRSLVLMTFTII